MDLREASITDTLLDQHNPYHTLNLILTSTGKCDYHTSSQLLLTEYGNHHRKTQLNLMQGSMDRGEPAPVDIATSQLLPLWLREHCGRRGMKDSERQYQKSAVKLSSRNGCINKTGTIAKAMDLLMQEEENSAGSNS